MDATLPVAMMRTCKLPSVREVAAWKASEGAGAAAMIVEMAKWWSADRWSERVIRWSLSASQGDD